MNEPVKDPAKDAQPLTVLYDGACPLCRREIGIYRGLQPLNADTSVCYADVSDPALPLPAGTTRQQLLARFHVRSPDGQLLSGAAAFLALWAVLPGWRWLALLGRVPGAAWVMEGSYRLFLRWRPTLQRWAWRLEPPGMKPPGPLEPGPGRSSRRGDERDNERDNERNKTGDNAGDHTGDTKSH